MASWTSALRRIRGTRAIWSSSSLRGARWSRSHSFSLWISMTSSASACAASRWGVSSTRCHAITTRGLTHVAGTPMCGTATSTPTTCRPTKTISIWKELRRSSYSRITMSWPVRRSIGSLRSLLRRSQTFAISTDLNSNDRQSNYFRARRSRTDSTFVQKTQMSQRHGATVRKKFQLSIPISSDPRIPFQNWCKNSESTTTREASSG